MRRLSGLVLSLLVVLPITIAQPQGKGQGKGEKPDKAQGGRSVVKQEKPRGGQGRSVGNARVDPPGQSVERRGGRGRGQSAFIDEFGGEVESRRGFRVFAASSKHGQRLAGRAIARAAARGLSDDDFIITPIDNRIRVLNRSGITLLDLDDNRDLGIWRVVTEPDRNKRGAPSFCRSGAGHPVWGRQWCVDKGFGLGVEGDFRWSRAIDFRDVTFMRPISTTELLTRELLAGLLGDVPFNRLAAHAITLGLVQPLTGRWIGQPVATEPRVLLVSSGPQPVAEVVDVNRDGRADMLLVATRP